MIGAALAKTGRAQDRIFRACCSGRPPCSSCRGSTCRVPSGTTPGPGSFWDSGLAMIFVPLTTVTLASISRAGNGQCHRHVQPAAQYRRQRRHRHGRDPADALPAVLPDQLSLPTSIPYNPIWQMRYEGSEADPDRQRGLPFPRPTRPRSA